MSSRRHFLQISAGIAADAGQTTAGSAAATGQTTPGSPAAPGQTTPGSPAAPGQTTASSPAAPGQTTAASPAATGQTTTTTAPAALPAIRLGKYTISRLILGSNPFYGYSHSSAALDRHMLEWATPEHVCQALDEAERNGITAFQTNARDRAVSDIGLYRQRGGKLQVIALVRGEPEDAVKMMRPMAVSHHGEATDVAFREQNMEQVREFTRRARQTGVLVGVSTHKPEVIEYIEERGWDVDFYMGCVYNRTRTPEELRKLLGQIPLPANEVYLEKDPQRMFATMRQTPRTCLAFKILAAGRAVGSAASLDAAFQAAFAGIKPGDAVIVGAYQRFKNEIGENAQRALRFGAPAS